MPGFLEWVFPPHVRQRRAQLGARVDLRAEFEELEESCVPSYLHRNVAAAWVAWQRLTAAIGLYRRCGAPVPVLDFGAGSGELRALLPADCDYAFIEHNERLAALIRSEHTDARRLRLEELRPASFGALFLLDALEHNPDYEALLQRLLEALRPDGVVILSGPSENVLYRLGRRIAGFSGHYHHTTIREIEQAAARHLHRVRWRWVPLGLRLFRVSIWKRPPPQRSPQPCTAMDNRTDGAQRATLVISTGRTGTTYLVQALGSAADRFAVWQERPPSRSLFLLCNAADRCPAMLGDLLRRLALAVFRRSRRRWLAALPPAVRGVEVNPFLTGLAPLLEARDFGAVVHMVRDPVSWVVSMRGFGAYGWRAKLAPFTPFVRSRHPAQSRRAGPLTEWEVLAWEWRHRNEQIEQACRPGQSCLRVRYEDLFDGEQPRRETFQRILAHLGAAPELAAALPLPEERVNPSARPRQARAALDETARRQVLAIAAPLLERYGYGPGADLAP